jgi:tRNA-dihydrouridine synthase
MKKNIWQQLNKPFLILAPMDDVTDTVFREIVANVAAPELSMTEFASSDGYIHPHGRNSVERRLRVNASEKATGVPVIAQIWGNHPDNYFQMAQDLAARGDFAGIDINMGCPEKGIVKRGCCGGLIKAENWENAAAIIQATKQGAGHLPVSVKTRIGLNQIITEDWLSHLLRQDLAAITVHGRTVKEMSRVPAHWDEIGKAVELRNQIAPQTLIIGNGDVSNRHQAEKLARLYNLDGIMIGRGIFHDIQAFAAAPAGMTPDQSIKLLLQHLSLYQQTWGDTKKFDPMKKFAKLYISGFTGAADLRASIMKTNSVDEAVAVLSGRTPVAAS